MTKEERMVRERAYLVDNVVNEQPDNYMKSEKWIESKRPFTAIHHINWTNQTLEIITTWLVKNERNVNVSFLLDNVVTEQSSH